ncbi:MAG: transposase-like protein [Parachlamydiales bacterium]|nr:transposase-like protein [Parachlamydiales bacterium]
MIFLKIITSRYYPWCSKKKESPMPSLIKKVKKGKSYYYIVQCARVNGKPRIVWQKYLGSVEAILEAYQKNAPIKPTETVLFEAGGIAGLLKFANRLEIINIVNKIIPSKAQGPSLGHYILLAALNRALEPTSKLQIGDWYRETVLQRLWGFPADAFTSQSYWNHMDRISPEAIGQIQDQLAMRIRQEFHIDTDALLYDTTNFFTYINTHNDRNEIAQRGRQKQKRCDLRQVNLALLTTTDFQIPLFHTTYPGNVPDVAFFPEITEQLLKRRSAIFGPCKHPMLVFDKGNLTDDTMGKLLYSDARFIGGIKADLLPEIFETPIEQFKEIMTMPGSKAYESHCEMHGKSCKVIVSYSESFFTQQLASLTASMAKCEEKLKALEKSLLARVLGKKKGKQPTKRQINIALEGILSGQYMKELYTVEQNFDGLPFIKYSVNRAAFEKIMQTRLGRTLLLTNCQDLLPDEIVRGYRELAHIEEAFKLMKNRDYLRWQPAFHWTDQKLEVHTLYCVLALLLATLARKTACEAGIDVSLAVLLDDLSAIKEVALIYSKDGRVNSEFTLNRMTPRQKKLAELFEIGEVLKG